MKSLSRPNARSFGPDVAFSDTERFIGYAAKNQATMNTVYDAKRLIGQRFDDPIVQGGMKLWSCIYTPPNE
jgi:molecular chaperone DnaK (HSP70)